MAESHASEDAEESEGVDPRAPLWGLLTFLCTAHEGGQVPQEDYVWYRARARLTLSELDVKPVTSPVAVQELLHPSPSPSPVGMAPVSTSPASSSPAGVSPTGATPSGASPAPSQFTVATSSSFSELIVKQSLRRKPHIVLSSEGSVPPAAPMVCCFPCRFLFPNLSFQVVDSRPGSSKCQRVSECNVHRTLA